MGKGILLQHDLLQFCDSSGVLLVTFGLRHQPQDGLPGDGDSNDIIG